MHLRKAIKPDNPFHLEDEPKSIEVIEQIHEDEVRFRALIKKEAAHSTMSAAIVFLMLILINVAITGLSLEVAIMAGLFAFILIVDATITHRVPCWDQYTREINERDKSSYAKLLDIIHKNPGTMPPALEKFVLGLESTNRLPVQGEFDKIRGVVDLILGRM